jgi:hypothetical protein
MAQDLPLDPYTEQTGRICVALAQSFEGIFEITNQETVTRDKGHYGVIYARPSKRVRNILSVDRELLVLVSTFEDQQSRTIRTARELIATSRGRLETTTFIVAHPDPRGNSKLKAWGREQNCVVLPVYISSPELPKKEAMLRVLAYELFSHDPFDVTGPVADDVNFYGRREEARELAKRLQAGQIRSCFGIRKIGKTSIIHRVIREMRDNYDCFVVSVDCQRDSIFNLNAAKLLNSLASNIELQIEGTAEGTQVSPIIEDVDITTAAERLLRVVLSAEKPIIVVFDEIDYISPGSPTAVPWQSEFNPFWRNLRAVYQQAALSGRPFSILVSGVSSKWFSVEAIGGIENAALALVPEEYMSPLPRGAAIAMIQRLGKLAGLSFSKETAGQISDTCADMPFWIRKACSYVHSKVEIPPRPMQPEPTFLTDTLREFVASDGSTMSFVALSHLFRVFPELKTPTLQSFEGVDQSPASRIYLRVMEKYGIIKDVASPKLSGLMMRSGLELMKAADAGEPDVVEQIKNISAVRFDPGFEEWADELAVISRRRNIIERKLRNVCANFIRYSFLHSVDKAPAKERVLKCIDAKRRIEVVRFELDDLMNRLFWLEVMSIIKKEWSLFEKIFGDQAEFDRNGNIINDRPDAHAKILDVIEIDVQRRALEWMETRLGKV